MLFQKWTRLILNVACGVILVEAGITSYAYGACGTTITWQADAGTTAWNTTTNWDLRNVPNVNTETAFIRADWQIPTLPSAARTLSCLEINSGSMTAPAASVLTIVNDYFRNLNSGSLVVPGGSTWQVSMAGTSTQSFDNVDPIPQLNINNSSTVNLTQDFVITNAFTITAGSGDVNIQGNLETQQTSTITIPSSSTVTISAGIVWKVNGGLTVNGVLKLMPGASLKMANGQTLSVGSTGTLQIAGTSGNVGIIDALNSSSTFTFSVAGKINASYFSINRMTSAGVNVTGQILDLSNGTLNYIPNGGYGLTLGAAATSITTISGVGFYGQNASTPLNVNATSYAGSAITFNNYSGIGGAANETDPSNKINWGTQAPVDLLLTNNSPSGAPPSTIATSSAYTHFATFSFALSSSATATNVTSIKFTIAGINNSSDVAGVKVYKETNNNCTYNAGTDTQVGGTYTVVGSPATFTATFSAGDIQVNSTTPQCVHVLLATSATAQTNNTLGIKIAATDDIVNSQNYNLSSTSGPPVSANTSTITGGSILRWGGGNGTTMAQANNWSPATIPSSTTDCQIGNGYSVPVMAATFSCLNTEFITGGTLNWNSTANIFQTYGAFTTNTGFTFQNTTTTAVLRFIGTSAQSVNFNGQTFPGSVQVNNSTGPVIFESNATISGSLTLNGGVTRVSSGVTLTVSGGITVNSGATLDIEPGGTLILANGTTLTVALGGTLELVGNTSNTANVRAPNNTNSYVITVNGTISARYYSLQNLGLTGLTINSGATIDATNQLQNGSYTYPGVNSAIFLRLFRQVPGNTLSSMTFASSGSTATGAKSISTNTTAGTLTVSSYSGDMTGTSYSTSVNYIVTWTLATNTLDLTQEATAPASSNQGAVVNMGRFGFKQTSAGAYSDTDITYMRLTLTGTGSASDVSSVNLYYDSACSGSGGTLLGTQTFSGSPARADFSSISGATVQAHATTPPKRCFYVTFGLSSTATNGATVGVQIQSSTHVTNSQSYAFNGSYAPPVSLGTTSIVGITTYWTGATNTAWATAGNWNGGLPTSSLNCVINSATNNPIISTGTQSCKSLTIGTGTLTMTGGSLEIYGSFDNTGTFTQGGFPLVIRDNGTTATAQTVSSSSTLTGLQFNKTAGGSVDVGSATLTVSSLITLPAGSNFTFSVPNSKTLVASSGITVNAGTLSVGSGGTVQIGSGQTLTLSGGTVATTGTNDAYPQSLSNKGTFTRQGGSGTWNFTATSGTLNLVGFVFEWLGTNGLNIGGTTNVTQINGGQLRSLPNSAGMKAIQLNTTGSLPSTISNFGWYWASGNSVPSEATAYYLGFSSGCSNRTVSFDQWFGDFWPYTSTNTDAKISETNCNIVIDKANSPVSLSEFKATPYNGQVVLEWTTGLEWYHKGFNLYRSLSPATGYVQINSELIRNTFFNTNMHGSYAFIDSDVENGKMYYYKLEDISTVEEHTLHGPVTAQPQASLGAPIPPLASTIVSNNPSGSQSSGAHGSADSTPGMVELEPNVSLLAKTQNSYRLKITIPNYQQSAHATHPSYQRLSLPLYSQTTEAGKPELLQRTFLLNINPSTSSQMSIVSEMSSVASVLVAPAPQWVLSGQNFVEQWFLDTAAYANSLWTPQQPISLGTIVQNRGQYYLPVVISPLSYQASSQNLKKYSEIVVDIFLNQNTSWTSTQPVALDQVWGSPGSLKIGIDHDGVYEISYDQMLQAGVIAPFDHQSVTQFKMYFLNQEHAIEIQSASGLFSSGDKIRFFAPHTETTESRQNYMLLVNDVFSPTPGLRMMDRNVSLLSGIGSQAASFSTRIHLEENNVAVFNEPYDQDMDLFVWGLYYGISGGVISGLSTDVQLPYLDPNHSVLLQAVVKSRQTTATNYTNTLRLSVNQQMVQEMSFSGSQVQVLNYSVDGRFFVPGLNRIKLEPTGSQLPAGEYDMVYIDAINVSYNQDWFAVNDQILVMNYQLNTDLSIDGFSQSNIAIYDLSLFGQPEIWSHGNVSATSNGFGVQFNTLNDAQKGRRLWALTESALQSPFSLELNEGSDLLNPANQADVLYVGTEELLDAVQPLAAYRQQQGYKTKSVSLKSIYNEFGQGLVRPEVIRDFFAYTQSHWSQKPQYFVLLGDGTYDPKAYQHTVVANRFPVKFIKGAAFNYGSDHWFVTVENETVPYAIVGRIPAANAQEMNDYVNKVLSYEQGELKPTKASLSVFSDQPLYNGENFEKFSNELVKDIALWNSQMPVSQFSRQGLGNANFKQHIQESFAQDSLIHYMGHGAENMWADSSVFTTNDIDLLANEHLPIVVAMNCLNAAFYDPQTKGFAEKLVMKKDGGAVAFWGSTSMSPPSVQSVYQKAFYEQLLTSQSHHLGEVVKMSKIQANQQSPYAEVMQSWTILGDPMVQPIVAPKASAVTSSGGSGSSGCSLRADYNSPHSENRSWDLVFALFLEIALSWCAIRGLRRGLRFIRS